MNLRLTDPAPFREIKSNYDLDYQNVNLELGRHFYISRYLSFHPFISVKSAWIDQFQKIFHVLAETPGVFGAGTSVKVKDVCDFWGIGPRVGFDSQWHLIDGFSVFGKVTGAVLFGYYKTRYSQRVSPGSTFNDLPLHVKIKGNTHLMSPTVQMLLGLMWETYMFDCTKHLSLALGYEVEYYWRTNQMLKVEDTNGFPSRRHNVERLSEDVMFYGLTFKVRFDF